MKLIYLKYDSFGVTIGIKLHFLEFILLLSRVAPYYSSLPRTVLNLKLKNKREKYWTRNRPLHYFLSFFGEGGVD